MREKVHTKQGDIEVPSLAEIGPRTKYWAGAMVDLVKVDELYRVMGAALEEAFNAGKLEAAKHFMFGGGEVIDVEGKVIDEAEPGVVEGRTEELRDAGELEGSEPEEGRGHSSGEAAERPELAEPAPAGDSR